MPLAPILLPYRRPARHSFYNTLPQQPLLDNVPDSLLQLSFELIPLH